MYFYIITTESSKFVVSLYRHFTSKHTMKQWAGIMKHHANKAAFTHFKPDQSLIGGYWNNAFGDSFIASPVELDKNGEVV